MPDDAALFVETTQPQRSPRRRRRLTTTPAHIQAAEDAVLRIEETIAQLQRALVDIKVAIAVHDSCSRDDLDG